MNAQSLFAFIMISKRMSLIERFHGKVCYEDYTIEWHESVAGHVAGMIFILTIFQFLPVGFDFVRAIEMVLLHDLPEVITGDICAVADDGTMNKLKSQSQQNL